MFTTLRRNGYNKVRAQQLTMTDTDRCNECRYLVLAFPWFTELIARADRLLNTSSLFGRDNKLSSF